MDVLKIAPTPLEAIPAHATLVINLQQILRPVLVNKTSSIAEYHATMLAALHSYLTMLFFSLSLCDMENITSASHATIRCNWSTCQHICCSDSYGYFLDYRHSVWIQVYPKDEKR